MKGFRRLEINTSLKKEELREEVVRELVFWLVDICLVMVGGEVGWRRI